MRIRPVLLASVFAIAWAVRPAMAQSDSTSRHPDAGTSHENDVKRQRRGAGIRMGSWQVQDAATVTGATTSTLPAFEGYWQHGLDKHVVLETSAGLWSRSQRSGGETLGSYVIPMLTSVKVYPMTGPGSALEPFMMGGAGFTLGIDDRSASSAGGVLGGGSGNGGTMIVPGIGLKIGGGVEYHLGQAFGVAVQGGYQYIRFLEDVANERTFKGVQMFAGLTYRFQF